MRNKWIAIAALGLGMTVTATADDVLAKGKEVYMGKGACMTCHGATGAGDGPAAAALDPKPVSFADGAFKYDTNGDGKAGTAEDLVNIITKGAAPYGGSMLMVGRPDITGDELDALVKYVLSLKKG